MYYEIVIISEKNEKVELKGKAYKRTMHEFDELTVQVITVAERILVDKLMHITELVAIGHFYRTFEKFKIP
jgi:hypothetical protein